MPQRENKAAAARARRRRMRRRRATVLVAALLAVGALLVSRRHPTVPLSPLRARIVDLAEGQLGYATDPSDSYCNRFSAFWGAGSGDCPSGERDEEWCADFAAWVWREAGAVFTYGFSPGDLNAGAVSFYQWGVANHTWHPVGSDYVPVPGDVAVYGLDLATMKAVHVAVVTGYNPGERGPDVVNGDGDRTGFSVVEDGVDQWKADLHDDGGVLAGYVAPLAPRPPPTSTGPG